MFNKLHPSHFRQLLNDNRDRVLVSLNNRPKDLFDSADVVLLDFTEQADNDTVQGRFFKAMGAVRKGGADMEQLFRQEITDHFERFGRPRFNDEVRDSDEDQGRRILAAGSID